MGMFDYIRCEAPLPDGFKGELQTKDFDCELVTHVITADGKLMLERIDEVHEVPKAERPYPNEEGLLGACGSIRTVTSLHEHPFDGVVNFYGYEGDPNDAVPIDQRWHEYNAKFTDGKLVEIVKAGPERRRS